MMYDDGNSKYSYNFIIIIHHHITSRQLVLCFLNITAAAAASPYYRILLKDSFFHSSSLPHEGKKSFVCVKMAVGCTHVRSALLLFL